MNTVTSLWHDRPAGQDWNRAYPLGSGRLGAIVFGNVAHERLQLNEDSLWSGGARDRVNPDALGQLAEIRRLILAGQPKAAEQLVQDAEIQLRGRTPGAYELQWWDTLAGRSRSASA